MAFLGRQYVISFILSLASIEPDICTSVLHLTTGQNSQVYGDNTPAVFHCNDGLVVQSAIDGQSDYSSPNITLKVGRKYYFVISQLLIENEVIETGKSCK